MNRRQVAIAVVVVILLGAGVVLAADHLVPTEGEIPLYSNDGPQVAVSGETDLNVESPFPDSETVLVETADGSMTFWSADRTVVEIHADDIEGEWTALTGLDVSDATLQADPADKDPVELSGGFSEFAWRNVTVGGSASLQYNASETATVTHYGLSSETDIVAATDTGEVLDTNTTDTGGTVSFELPAQDELTDVRLAHLPDKPEVVESWPVGGQSVPPTDATVNVTHDDRGFLDVETTVAFYFEGDHIATETTTDAGNVSTSISNQPITAGENNWSVVVSDDFDQETTENYTFLTPDELRVFNEETLNLINSVDVDIQFYEAGTRGDVFNRSTDDGTIDMEGLPADLSFVAVAHADNYIDRRIYIESLFEQQEIYLLDDAANVTQATFELTDFSGDFREEQTVLEIQRHIDGEWKAVEGDHFGATGQFDATLKTGERHELVAINVETGATRDLGSFTPGLDGAHEIQIDPDLEATIRQPSAAISWSPSVERIYGAPEQTLSATLSGHGAELGSFDAAAYFDGNLVWSESGSDVDVAELDIGPINTTEGGTLEVVIDYETDTGETGEFTKTYDVRESMQNEYSLVSWLTGLGSHFGEGWGPISTMASIFLTVMFLGLVASRSRMSTELLGVSALLSLLFFALIGWFPMRVIFAGVATWVAFAALRRIP